MTVGDWRIVGQLTYRLGGLERAGGERVAAAAALGAEVRRGGRGVVDVRQDVVVSPLLLRPVRVVAIGGRGSREGAFCDWREEASVNNELPGHRGD